MAQKILIVDDNALTRGALVKLLADAGFETMTATTVPEAMRALARPGARKERSATKGRADDGTE